jgi:hypothetical protein
MQKKRRRFAGPNRITVEACWILQLSGSAPL